MKILWSNVAALALLVLSLVLVLRNLSPIRAFFGTIDDIGPGHSTDEQFRGLAAFGLAVVSLLGALRVLLNRRDKENP